MPNVDVTRDAPPTPQLPIDSSVKLPDSVTKAAAVANSYYQQAPAAPAPDAANPAPEPANLAPEPANVAAPEAPKTPVQAAPEPAPEPAPTPAPVTEDQWEHRFRSMKGRYDSSQQTIGAMQEQMQQMGDELLRTQQMLMQNGPRQTGPKDAPNSPTKLITAEDEQNYGNDLIDLARRAGREAVAGDLEQVKSQNAQLQQQLQREAQNRVVSALDAQMPNWREINTDPRFISWLNLPDLYSGVLKKQMLKDAFRAANAPRVLAFFKGFVSDEALTGNVDPTAAIEQPKAPRVPAVPLERLAAPGRARPAGGDTPTSSLDKPIYTRQQISNFYTLVRQGAYAGRDADKARDEAAIFAAQSEGRVR